MTILLTGGLGYIGSHTCVVLQQAGHQVIIVDNLSNASPAVLPRLQQITGVAPVFYQLDVRDEAALSAVFDAHDIGCVVHLAGLKAVGESVTMPLTYYDNNLNATLALCRVMAAHHVKRLVFSSSATVYSGDNAMPLTENSRTGQCTNPYGWSKYMIEQMLRDLARSDPEWSILLLRYFNPIGAHKSGLIGESPRGVPNNLVPYLTQTACGIRECLSVFGNDYDTPDGTGVRDYLHVCDLARGHLAALSYVWQHPGVQAVNLGTGRGYSVLELIHTFEMVTGVVIPYRIAPRRPGDLAVSYTDPSLSHSLLHWRAEQTLSDMLRDAWNWQCKNPEGYGPGDTL